MEENLADIFEVTWCSYEYVVIADVDQNISGDRRADSDVAI